MLDSGLGREARNRPPVCVHEQGRVCQGSSSGEAKSFLNWGQRAREQVLKGRSK